MNDKFLPRLNQTFLKGNLIEKVVPEVFSKPITANVKTTAKSGTDTMKRGKVLFAHPPPLGISSGFPENSR